MNEAKRRLHLIVDKEPENISAIVGFGQAELNSFSDRQGICFPSRMRITRLMGHVSLRTVPRAIREATELQLDILAYDFSGPSTARLIKLLEGSPAGSTTL